MKNLSRRSFLEIAGTGLLGAAFTPVSFGKQSDTWSPIRGRTDLVIEIGNPTPWVSVNADKPIIPASMTKAETLGIVVEQIKAGNIDPEKRIKLSPLARSQPPFKSGLRYCTIEEALYLSAVRSYNDTTFALAEETAGTEWDFHREFMKPFSDERQMKDSDFWNVTGLPKKGIGENITTASDLAKLAEYLITEHPDYFDLFGQATYEHPKFSEPLINTNGLLEDSTNRFAVPTKGVDWGKTGYIDKAGFQIVCSCERNRSRLIIVSTGHASALARNQHVNQMIENVFALKQELELKEQQQMIENLF